MRAIDADALESKIKKQYCEDCNRRKGENNGKRYMVYEIGDAPCRACSIDDMYAELDDAPTIQPKRGRWHYSDGKPARIGLSFGVICDQCGTESEYCTNFCGECGADMRGEQDG